MSRGTSRVRMLSPASVASSLQHITASDRHSEPTSSSDESFASISDASTSDEDDEIVWSMSDLSVSGSSQLAAMRSPGVLSDDDFIVLSPPLSQPREPASQTTSLSSSFVGSGAQSSSFDGLSEVMSNLNITESDSASDRSSSKASSRKQRKRAARATTAATTPVPAPATTKPKKKKSKGTVGSAPAERSASTSTKSKAKKAQASAKAQSGLGKRPIVDDVSEAGDAKTAVYEEAVQYVSEILAAPTSAEKAKSNLTFLQALILELGLLSACATSPEQQSFSQLPSLPRSMKAAKELLKSKVFMNVRDYLDARNKGLDALRNVMHPSRKALIRDLSRGNGQRKVPRGFVKQSGLGVLLVTCYH